MNVNLDNMARLAIKAMVWARADLERQAAIDRTQDPRVMAHPFPTTGFNLYGLHWTVQLVDLDRVKVSTSVRPGVDLFFTFPS